MADCSCRNGQCVPNPDVLSHFQQVCLCNAGFSGQADYFDLRIFRNASLELSLDCTVSDAGTTAIWSLFLIVYSTRLILTLFSIAKFLPAKKLRPVTVRLMLFDLVANFIAITLPIQKLASPADSVLGTSIAATSTHVFANFGMNVVWSLNQIEEFKMLSNTRTWRQLLENRLGVLQVQLQSGFVATYFLIGVISFVALGLDRSRGPIQNNELVVLLFRNLGFLIWTVFLFVGATKMQQREFSTRNLLLNLQGAERPTRVVEYLAHNKKRIKKQVFVAFSLYLIFSLPPLWDQQYINIGLTNILLAFTSSVGQVLLRSEQAAKKGTTATNKTTATTSSGGGARNKDADGNFKQTSQRFEPPTFPAPPAPTPRDQNITPMFPPPPPLPTSSDTSSTQVLPARKLRKPEIIAAYAMQSVEPSY